jgi:membrane protease YdiL (CAAX protease family)
MSYSVRPYKTVDNKRFMAQNAGPWPASVPGTASLSWMAPDSGAPPISAVRAYAEVLILFALVFASGIISAAESLGGNDLVPSGSWGTFAPATVDEVCNAAVIVIAVVLLSKRRGVTGELLGIRMPQPLPGVGPGSRATRMAALGLLAFLGGGIVTSLLAGSHGYQEPTSLSVPYLVYSVGGSLFSGVVEEMVALAFVVSTLRQARRPAAEIVVVAVLLRCSYHVYYGAGIVGIAIWATVFALLYLRFRSVIPLIVLHFLWDSFQFLGLKWPAVAGLGMLLGVCFVITAFIVWIVAAVRHQHAKHPQPGGFAPYPGAMYPAPPYPAGVPYQGAPYQGVPYPGTPYPGVPHPGAQYPGTPYPVARPPAAAGQPWPPAPYPQAYPQPPYGPPVPPGYAGPAAPPA